ncbi:MAG: alpha/beta hydrolase [Anaerofustis stercorihominis]|nr:alpha/beta hydrolase [Anaerofustis stercorihominis]
MNKEIFEITGYKGKALPCAMWLPEGKTEAVLQITHGMTEHMGRYDVFAQRLCENNIAVIGYDLRGHGKNGASDVASFGEGGWEASIEDMRSLSSYVKSRFSGKKHYMLGFSLGSFLLREYMNKYPDGIDGAVILGTGYQPPVVLSVMMAVVKTQIKKAGFDGTTNLVRELSFGTYNKKFSPNRTSSDWLCSDERELDKYITDELCKKDISAGLFYQLLGSMKKTGRKDAYDKWNKDMPVLLISGKDDPVGDMGKGIDKVFTQMLNSGMKHVKRVVVDGARHDVLHEYSCGASHKATEEIIVFTRYK